MSRKSVTSLLTAFILIVGGGFTVVSYLSMDITSSPPSTRVTLEAEKNVKTTVPNGLLTERRDKILHEVRQRAEGILTAGDTALADSEGKVLSANSRDALASKLVQVREVLGGYDFALINSTLVEVSALTEQVRADVQAWETEQVRLAEEARLAEESRKVEEARKAEAARKSEEDRQSQSQSNATSSSPPQAQAPANNGGGFKQQVAAIAARYGCGYATISVDDPELGGWNGGAVPLGSSTIMISSNADRSRLEYIVAHECAHVLQGAAYGWNWEPIVADMNAIYGGTGLDGVEQNADCVTQRWGFSQHRYTTSCGGARGTAAAAIASGQRP